MTESLYEQDEDDLIGRRLDAGDRVCALAKRELAALRAASPEHESMCGLLYAVLCAWLDEQGLHGETSELDDIESALAALSVRVKDEGGESLADDEQGRPEVLSEQRQRVWVVRAKGRRSLGGSIVVEHSLVVASTKQDAFELWHRSNALPSWLPNADRTLEIRELTRPVVTVSELTEPLTDQDWSQEDD